MDTFGFCSGAGYRALAFFFFPAELVLFIFVNGIAKKVFAFYLCAQVTRAASNGDNDEYNDNQL